MEKEKRERNKDIHVRASDKEYAQIKKVYERSGHTNLNDFCIDMLQHGFVINVDTSDLMSLIYEVNKIGVNINQIAHKVNENGAVGVDDIKELQEQHSILVHVVNSQMNKLK